MAKVTTGPKVQFSQVCWQKMWALVYACKIEISWIMQLATDEEKEHAGVDADFYYIDVHVVDQVCSGVKSDMKDAAFGELVSKLMDLGVDPSLLTGWGHSHVEMSVAFSGTDEATIERLQLEPLISVVLNKKGDVNIRCDVWEPWRHSFDCTYSVDEIKLIPDSWGKEMVEAHVEKEKIPVYKPGKYSHSKGKKSKNSFPAYTWGTEWYSSGKSHWDDIADVKFDESDEEVGTIDSELDLPENMSFIQTCYEDGIIGINEVVSMVAEIEAGVRTLEEIEDELEQLFCVAGTEVKEDKLVAGVA